MTSSIRDHIAEALQRIDRGSARIMADEPPDPASGRPNPIIESILDLRDLVIEEQAWIRAVMPSADSVRDRTAIALYRMGCAAFEARSAEFLAAMPVMAFYRQVDPPAGDAMGEAIAMLSGMDTLLAELNAQEAEDEASPPTVH